ncbi:MAG: hypothetical protein ACRDGS_09770 [Chloroflexota bacterium]
MIATVWVIPPRKSVLPIRFPAASELKLSRWAPVGVFGALGSSSWLTSPPARS